MILSGLLENMANFAVFDQDVNVSLESKFLPEIKKSQTVENENRQHKLPRWMTFFCLPSVNEYL